MGRFPKPRRTHNADQASTWLMLEIELAFSIEQKHIAGLQKDVKGSKEMTGIMNLKEMFRNSFSRSDSGAGMPNSPSFSDFSMGVGNEVEDSADNTPRGSLDIAEAAKSPRIAKSPKSVWQSVFHPGGNPVGMKSIGKDYYDNADKYEHSVWDEVVKAERRKVFNTFDRDNDGYISAADLQAKLGNTADVAQLIAAADKNGDGRIDYYEFQELLRNS